MLKKMHSPTLMVRHHSHGSLAVLTKLEMYIPLDLVILSRYQASQYTHMRQKINAKGYSLCIEIAKRWQEPKCPSVGD